MSLKVDCFHISLKLDKGNGRNARKISHDPNVGFLSAVINCFEIMNPGSKYIIDDHGIQQEYFNKSPKSKLWHALNKIDIEFTGCVIKKRPELPKNYFTIESAMTEKLATILCDMTTTDRTIFSNHGGCALTNIKGLGDRCHDVGRKMPRPDIVFANDSKKSILIIEGKVEKDLLKGITQLSYEHLKGFTNILNNLYPDYTIVKGLCITIDNIDNVTKYDQLEFPIKFAIDNNGSFIDLR